MSHWNDEHANRYDEQWGELDFHQQIPGLAGVQSGFNVVELGCGGGYLSVCLAQSAVNVRVTALDPTAKMIALAQARQQRAGLSKAQLQFFEAGAESLDVSDNTQDLVVAAFSVHHWQSPAQSMALVYSALKSGGKIWLCEDLNAPTEGNIEVHSDLKALDGLKSLLQNSGFVQISHTVHRNHEGKFLIVEALKL
ncbi:class I SAM-dependent methyltransferase [Pseudoalteromonas sp. OOF1S-7]|uniref:class I SAM-dependent methyltransferase n=1 Tax=Pseudoalteromonas sp. OOF1S-7 TaxID=2917757 RepID=UPI001EF4EFB9|nr:class I SAM-dependent methyltransferase [Pseudoalteromonas sp. OOF1S-7]MCG7533543.1 class I SAM-dependent methyltransferase [Pseudoalteromonas sp. OOF1S-7]